MVVFLSVSVYTPQQGFPSDEACVAVSAFQRDVAQARRAAVQGGGGRAAEAAAKAQLETLKRKDGRGGVTVFCLGAIPNHESSLPGPVVGFGFWACVCPFVGVILWEGPLTSKCLGFAQGTDRFSLPGATANTLPGDQTGNGLLGHIPTALLAHGLWHCAVLC